MSRKWWFTILWLSFVVSLVPPATGIQQWPVFMYWLNGLVIGVGFVAMVKEWQLSNSTQNRNPLPE